MQFTLPELYGRINLTRAAVIMVRASIDIEKKDIRKALSRLEGALEYDPLNQLLHYFAGKTYCEIGDKIRAGKHFYLLQSTSLQDTECVLAFEKSLGNDPILILRKIHKRGTRLAELDHNAKEKIKELVREAAERYCPLPRFIMGLKRSFDKV